MADQPWCIQPEIGNLGVVTLGNEVPTGVAENSRWRRGTNSWGRDICLKCIEANP